MRYQVPVFVAVGLLVPLPALADLPNDIHTSGPDLAWVEYHNATPTFHRDERNALRATHRLISLDMAGNGDNVRYAAVWIKTATAPDQHFTGPLNLAGDACCSVTALGDKMTEEQALGYYPVIVSASGDTEPRYQAVFEKTTSPTLVSFGNQATLLAYATLQRDAGQFPRWVTAFGGSSDPTYLSVWEPLELEGGSGALPAFAVTAGASASLLQQQANAYGDAWARPGMLAQAPDGTYFAAWYDSLLEGGESSFADLDAAGLDALIVSKGLLGAFPMQVQAVKRSGDLRYAVLFADPDVIAAGPDRRLLGTKRTFASHGLPDLTVDPTLKPLEDKAKSYMKQKGIRSMTLAVGYRGRLIFARAFTWAELDAGYPEAEPTQRFRIGSISKMFAVAAANVLAQDGTLDLDDKLLDDLPDDLGSPEDDDFDQISLRGIIAHRSGLPRVGADPATISKANNDGAVILPISRHGYTGYTIRHTTLELTPGTAYGYSNLAYVLLGEAIAFMFDDTYPEVLAAVLYPALYEEGHHPRVSETRFADQVPEEPHYHSSAMTLVQSVMDSAQPWVPNQYGAKDMSMLAAAGGMAASAPQVVKLMTVYWKYLSDNPLLDDAHLTAILGPLEFIDGTTDPTKTMGGFKIKTFSTDPDCDIPVLIKSYEKGGAVPGARAETIVRDDGLVIAVAINSDTNVKACKLNQWAAAIDLAAVPASTDYFETYHVLGF